MADRTRGTPWQRGYDARHRTLRQRLARQVATGAVLCAKCDQIIHPGTPWDLGHTRDRTGWTGPEHAACNRADGGRTATHPPRD